jgi:ribonucleoside-diphosphate reductase alpha chain
MKDNVSNFNSIQVIKRNGTTEDLNIEKIHKMVHLACDGIAGVSVSDIVMQARLSFFNGITTTEIHRALTKAASDLITENSPNYQYVAGRLLNYDMRKMAWGGMEPPKLYPFIVRMINDGYYTKDLLEMYSEEEWNKIENFIDHDRDLEMTHIGVSEYVTKYAVRDRSLNEIVPLETPQFTYILVAAVLCSREKSLKAVKSYYNDISNWNISLPTPIMAGVRTPTRQFSSCVLIECGDSLDSIIASTGAIVKYASKRAGIGLEASAIRAEGSKVGNGEIRHTGVVPFYRMFESALKSCSQGGIRGASLTLYTAIWHLEIQDILVLKNNKGTQDNRVRKLDYGIQINNYFYNKFIKGENITLFSPSEKETPGLREAFFADKNKFIELYEKYEKDENIRKLSIPASELFTKLMMERKDTGRIYIFNVDNVNNYVPFDVPIRTSNLCAEILLPTQQLNSVDDDNGRVALCTLSAINLGNIRNLDDLEKIMWNAVSKLDNLLDYQEYMLPAAREATLDYRPLGIGVVNLAYYLAKNGVRFNDTAALHLLHDTFEALSFYGIKASMELAKLKGPCREHEKTKYARGILPIDRYNKNVDKLITPSYKLDWEWLRGEIKKYGIRNATILANMPAESSSKIMNATNGQEAVRSLITVKGNKSNISKQVVPEIGRLKNKYDLLWEMKNMDGIIHTAAVMQKFICQSLSTNLSYNPANYDNAEIPMSVLLGDLLKCNYYGIRTLYYHNTNDQKDVDMVENHSENVKNLETHTEVKEECDSCTI